MINNLKLIFIHGISDQQTNYSQELYKAVLAACRTKLLTKGQKADTVEESIRRIVHHEILWANITTDLTERYAQLQYPPRAHKWFWGHFTQGFDPLAIQIMQYIKDKGDHQTGDMNILNAVHKNFQIIFSEATDDIGQDDEPAERNSAIVIGHSLGSVIAFDYIMGFRPEYALSAKVSVKSLITIGSPVALFTSAMGHPDSDCRLPDNVLRWVNILSPRDGIARNLKPFFRYIPIEEHEVGTGFWPLKAHGGYWTDAHTAGLIADEVLKALDAQT